jgi:uncharacterized protein YggU (UPF0235/DUF167 family)
MGVRAARDAASPGAANAPTGPVAPPARVGARPGAGEARTRFAILARPGSDRAAIEWDPWRESWVVHCREPPVQGAANEAILALLAGWLSMPASSVRWVHAGRSARKRVEVLGLDEAEVRRRLAAREGPRPR